MSDAPTTEQPTKTPAGIWEHWCDAPNCKSWGALGYQEGGRQLWFCGEHKHIGEERRR